MLNTQIGNADYTSQIFNQEAQDGNWQSYKPQMTCNIKKIDILSQSTITTLFSRDLLEEGEELIIFDGQSFKKALLGPVTYDGSMAPIQRITEANYTNKFKNLGTTAYEKIRVVNDDKDLLALDANNGLHRYEFGVPGDVSTLTNVGSAVALINSTTRNLKSHVTTTLGMTSYQGGSWMGPRIYLDMSSDVDERIHVQRNGYGIGVNNLSAPMGLNFNTFVTETVAETTEHEVRLCTRRQGGTHHLYKRYMTNAGYALSSSIGDFVGMSTQPYAGVNYVYTKFSGGIQQRTIGTLGDARTVGAPVNTLGLQTDKILFHPDGTRLYAINKSNGLLVQYNLSTPWDLSTAVLTVSHNIPDMLDFTLNRTGTQVLALTNPHASMISGYRVVRYPLSTAWNLSTVGASNRTSVIVGYHMCAAIWGSRIRYVFHEFIGDFGSPTGNPNVVSIAPMGPFGNYVYCDIGSTNYGSKGVHFEVKSGRLFVNCVNSSAGTMTLREFNTTTGATLQTRTISSIPFRQFSFSHDGTRIFARTSSTQIGQFNLSTPWVLSSMSTTPANTYNHFTVSDDCDISNFLYANGTRSIFIGNTEYNLNNPNNLNTIGRVTTRSNVLTPGTMLSTQEGTTTGSVYFLDGFGIGASQAARWYRVNEMSIPQFFGTADVPQSETDINGFDMSEDGSKLFLVGGTTRSIFRLDLSTPYQISSATFTPGNYFKMVADSVPPTDIFMRDNGATAFIGRGTSQNNNAGFRRITFSTPFDVTSGIEGAVWVEPSSAERIGFYSSLVSKNGKRVFGLRRTTTTNRPILEHEVPNGWTNFTGATYTTFTRTFTTQDNQMTALAKNKAENKLYLYGTQFNNIYEYDMNIAAGGAYECDISGHGLVNAPQQIHRTADIPTFQTSFGMPGRSLINHHPIVPSVMTTTTMEYDEFSGRVPATGDSLRVFNSGNPTTPEVTTIGTVSSTNHTPTSIALAQFDSTYSFMGSTGVGSAIESLTFNTFGTKAYIVNGSTSRRVIEFDLSTPFDVSTAAYNGVFLSVSAQDTAPVSATFDKYGKYLFVVGKTNRRINRYTLAVPFDLSTATFDSFLSVSAQATAPESIMFSSNGKRLYVVNSANGRIIQYNLTAPYKLEGGTYANLFFSVGSQIGAPVTAKFNNDGTKMYVAGSNGVIHQYSMSNPYGVSTATYDSVSLNINANANPLKDIAFSRDGKTLYGVDGAGQGSIAIYDDVSVHNYVTYEISFSAVSSVPDSTHPYPELARRRTNHVPTGFSRSGVDDLVCSYDTVVAEGRELAFHHVGKNPQDIIKMTRYDLTKSNI